MNSEFERNNKPELLVVAPEMRSMQLIQRSITLNSPRLQSLQKGFALTTILVPAIGTLAALVSSWLLPVRWLDAWLFLITYSLTIIGITVGFHRHFSHKAFESTLMVRVILAILGSMAAQGPLIQWVATHRRHHQYSDQPEDPHSPYICNDQSLNGLHGLWHSHLGWMINGTITNSLLYAKDLLREPVIVKISQWYLLWVILGIAIPAAIEGVLTRTWSGVLNGLLWGGLVRLFLAHHISWAIGSLAHLYGTSPFNTDDHSKNNFWLAIPDFGEAWHNNHHAFPHSAFFGLEWWQVDFGAWIIWLLGKTGLAWNIKSPSRSAIKLKKLTETLNKF